MEVVVVFTGDLGGTLESGCEKGHNEKGQVLLSHKRNDKYHRKTFVCLIYLFCSGLFSKPESEIKKPPL